jgi:hypothetical protein
MSENGAAVSPQFEALLSAFVQSVGLQGTPDAFGIEFQSGDHSVVVLPHPTREDALVVEVSVAELDPSGSDLSALLKMLHVINEASRFEHGWTITVTPEDGVLIYLVREISDTSTGDLETLLAEGIDRADALRQIMLDQAEVEPVTGMDDETSARLGERETTVPSPLSGFIRA